MIDSAAEQQPAGRSALEIVVNAPGVQEGRADAFATLLRPRFERVEVSVAPTTRELARLVRGADALYVIDAGRRGALAALAGRLARRRVVVELGDPQGALFAAQGRGRAAVALGRAIDRAVTLGADGVVVRGSALARTLDVRVPWVTVPDGVDTERFRPAIDPGARSRLGLDADHLVVGVVGTLTWSPTHERAYGFDIVDALAELSDLPVSALVVGDGSGRERLEAHAARLGVADRVVMTGRVPHADVPALIDAMDVCVSTQSMDVIGAGRTTAKLPEYLACDRFVLATRVGGADGLLPPEMLIAHEAPLTRAYSLVLAERLRALVPRRAELRAGAGTRQLALRELSYPVLAERLARFLQHVMA